MLERDRALTYYTDTSVWNQLVHQPGHPEYVARLKRARDEGTAQTYVSRHLLQELIGTFVKRPEIGARLMKAVQDIALRGWCVKDTPILNRQDVMHLIDPSVKRDFLEEMGSLDSRKMAHAIDELAKVGPLDRQWADFCSLQLQKQQDYKTRYMEAWEEFVDEQRQRFDPTRIPPTFEAFMGDTRSTEIKEAMVHLWSPQDLKKLIPNVDLAKRLNETVSFRGMLFYLSSVFYWKVLRKDALHPGDAFDAHHETMAANFDLFICRDEMARKYATSWCRNGQRVATLEEFVKDLG